MTAAVYPSVLGFRAKPAAGLVADPAIALASLAVAGRGCCPRRWPPSWPCGPLCGPVAGCKRLWAYWYLRLGVRPSAGRLGGDLGLLAGCGVSGGQGHGIRVVSQPWT